MTELSRFTNAELQGVIKICNKMGDVIFVLDNHLNIIKHGDAVYDFLQLSPSKSIIKHSLPELLSSQNIPHMLDLKGNHIASYKNSASSEVWNWSNIHFTINNHPEQYILLIGKQITYDSQVKNTFQNFAFNFTSHETNESISDTEQIKELENYLTSIINKIPCVIYWKNTSLQYVGCNDMAMNFVDLPSKDDIIGKTDYDLFEDKVLAESYRKDDEFVLQTGTPILNQKGLLVARDGSTAHTLVSKAPIKKISGEIAGIVGITIDVTEQVELSQKLQIAKEKAEAANKAKSEFIANMSHDLRTPLSGVVGMSEILQEHETDPENAQYAMWIHDCSHQLLGLLNGILDIVKLGNTKEDKIKTTTFDFYQCIDELAQLEMPTIKLKGLDLLINIDEEIPQFIKTDRIKIHRILLNLLGNAIKFTEAGHIAIDVKLLNQTKDKVTLYFAISDTGIGIPEDQQDKVFDRFHRVNSSYKGAYTGHGIGLNIAQSYVKCLGGDIQLTSKPDVGTSCYFELTLKIGKKEDVIEKPLLQSDKSKLNASKAIDTIEHVSNVNAHSERSFKLLIIEDNLVARRTFEQLANKAGCSILSADNGKTGVELAKTNDLDLIITDIGLPDISGYDVTKQIREWEKSLNKSTPIIGLTAHAKSESQKESIQSGMNDIFSKPISNTLLQTMLKFIETKRETSNTPQQNEKPPTKRTLGQDLPETEDDLFKINTYPLVDIEYAISIMGSEEMVREILPLMMADETQNDINAIKKAYEEQDWNKVEKLAHKMKGGAVNCGAIRMKYACQYLERYRKAGYQQLLTPLYQQLIKVIKETQCYIKEWVKK